MFYWNNVTPDAGVASYTDNKIPLFFSNKCLVRPYQLYLKTFPLWNKCTAVWKPAFIKVHKNLENLFQSLSDELLWGLIQNSLIPVTALLWTLVCVGSSLWTLMTSCEKNLNGSHEWSFLIITIKVCSNAKHKLLSTVFTMISTKIFYRQMDNIHSLGEIDDIFLFELVIKMRQ